MSQQEDEWKEEVSRNTENLCVYCGKKMVATIFHDIPVCEEHLNIYGLKKDKENAKQTSNL